MTDPFASLISPVFQQVIDLQARLEAGESPRWEAERGTVTVELQVPRMEGEVPLTATRGGAAEERL